MQHEKTQIRRRGRPPQISREMILEAAAAIPAEQLVMPEVADRLGVKTQTLYRYFPTRDALVIAISQGLMQRMPLRRPDPTHWRAWLRDSMQDYHRYLLQHPIILHAIDAHGTRPALFTHVLGAVSTLHGAGFSVLDAYTHALSVGLVARHWAQTLYSVRLRDAGGGFDELVEKLMVDSSMDEATQALFRELKEFRFESAFEVALDNAVRGIPEPEPKETAQP